MFFKKNVTPEDADKLSKELHQSLKKIDCEQEKLQKITQHIQTGDITQDELYSSIECYDVLSNEFKKVSDITEDLSTALKNMGNELKKMQKLLERL